MPTKVGEYVRRYDKDITSKIKVAKKAELLVDGQSNVAGFMACMKDRRDAWYCGDD
jgi:hypothetical protein